MDEVLLLRQAFGSVYATILHDGRIIPWKPLSIKEFNEYETLFKKNFYPIAFLENEIFDKCVVDKVLVDLKDSLNAGIITSVVDGIMRISGPKTPEDMQEKFNAKRIECSTTLHLLINLIIQAFPAYKIEDLYALDYEEFMSRAAQAEIKLIHTGLLKEPISLFQEQDQNANKPPPRRQKPDTSNLLEKFYEQQGVKNNIAKKKPKSSPVDLNAKKQVVITTADQEEHQLAYTGHELEDKMILEHKMVKETAHIYEDYLAQMREGKNVKIKTHEEQVAEGKKLIEKQRKMASLMAQQQVSKKKAEDQDLAKKLIEKATKKRR